MNPPIYENFARNVVEMKSKIRESIFSMNSEHFVQITHINDPHSFYVRLSSLRYTLKLLEKPGDAMIFCEVLTGRIVVYKSKTLKRYVRGRVLKRGKRDGTEITARILAIDYGCIDENIPIIYMYFPRKLGTKCVPLAIYCKLYDCEPLSDAFDGHVIDVMKSCVDNYTAKIIVRFKSPEKLHVELRTTRCDVDISTKLAELGLASSIGRENEVPEQEAIQWLR